MRNLTQQEIDNAPGDCSDYSIFDNKVIYAGHKAGMVIPEGMSLMWAEAFELEYKPIPRKEFDISEYEFSGDITAYGPNGQYVTLDERDSQIVVSRSDIIALAKHFKLTASDLNTQ